MAEMEQARELLAQIKVAWDKAEQAIKRAELVCGEVVTPAIKELRYAGRRLADGLEAVASGTVTPETNGFLRDALFDCYRARHDAIDAAISKIAVEIDLSVRRLDNQECGG